MDEPAPVSDLTRALTDSGVTWLDTKPKEAYRRASKREASSRGSRELQGHFSPRVVFGHIDTPYRSNEPIYASQAYLRVPMVNIDGGTMSSSSNAGPAEGKV